MSHCRILGIRSAFTYRDRLQLLQALLSLQVRGNGHRASGSPGRAALLHLSSATLRLAAFLCILPGHGRFVHSRFVAGRARHRAVKRTRQGAPLASTLAAQVESRQMHERLALSVMLAFLGSAGAADEAEPPRYSLRSDAGARGRFGPSEAFGAVVPFNRTYAQLTDEQKARIKGYYVGMSEEDEPPYPERGLEAIYGVIAEGQARIGVVGDLDLEVVVAPDGTAQEVRVYKTPHRKVTQFVANLVMLTPFKPGICGGKPCTMNFPVRVRFDLR